MSRQRKLVPILKPWALERGRRLGGTDELSLKMGPNNQNQESKLIELRCNCSGIPSGPQQLRSKMKNWGEVIWHSRHQTISFLRRKKDIPSRGGSFRAAQSVKVFDSHRRCGMASRQSEQLNKTCGFFKKQTNKQ